jgi:hypothetical protein
MGHVEAPPLRTEIERSGRFGAKVYAESNRYFECPLTRDLEELVERLAENNHDTWAQKRINEGWRYGPRRNDDAQEHPDLVPYE